MYGKNIMSCNFEINIGVVRVIFMVVGWKLFLLRIIIDYIFNFRL